MAGKSPAALIELLLKARVATVNHPPAEGQQTAQRIAFGV